MRSCVPWVWLAVFCLSSISFHCRSVPEELSVVSVYTTQSSAGHGLDHLDVYQQIANNIAERITSPIYNFLGIRNNRTSESKRPSLDGKIEILDEEDIMSKSDIRPIGNDITDRDVEELSVEALKKKTDSKPEKFTLYSTYLPGNQKLEEVTESIEVTSTTKDFDGFDDDDDDELRNKINPQGFQLFLETIGKFVTLGWSVITSLFPNQKF